MTTRKMALSSACEIPEKVFRKYCRHFYFCFFFLYASAIFISVTTNKFVAWYKSEDFFYRFVKFGFLNCKNTYLLNNQQEEF